MQRIGSNNIFLGKNKPRKQFSPRHFSYRVYGINECFNVETGVAYVGTSSFDSSYRLFSHSVTK